DNKLDCALDIIRRLSPVLVENSLASLIDLEPNLAESLLSTVDVPLKVRMCSVSGKEYLLCDYNRDGDSFRSPWSNAYEPEVFDEQLKPSAKLRELEELANEAFKTYKDFVYMWDLNCGFAATVAIKKVEYKLTSTVMLYIIRDGQCNLSLTGSLTRQELTVLNATFDHISNLGTMVEDMENKLRSNLQDIYFGKTKDIVNELRGLHSLQETNHKLGLQKEIMLLMKERK
ncbi:F-actin capping protein, beta subunit, partial [Rozella allomycis CSF55]